MLALVILLLGAILPYFYLAANGEPIPTEKGDDKACRKTKVAVLGAGMAGITAAKRLSDTGIHDFVIVENNDRIGGRVWAHEFGKDNTSSSRDTYTVELGANWIHGDRNNDSCVSNPIWEMAEDSSLRTHLSDYSNTTVFDSSVKLSDEENYRWYSEFSKAFGKTKEDAEGNPMMLAIEWAHIDWELAQSAVNSSRLFSTVSFKSTEDYFSRRNHFVLGPSRYASLIEKQAATFLEHETAGSITDSRLVLQHRVYEINATSPSSVIIRTKSARKKSCIEAEQVIVTFSIGVLQHMIEGNEALTFIPELPSWKTKAINAVDMGTYTKIFMQWRHGDVFWPDTQFILHASPRQGYYPMFQNLDIEGFHPGSGILFATVTGEESLRVDRQSDERTKREILQVLHTMFPNKHIPEPEHFFYPRWSTYDWVYGSYSNVPTGVSLFTRQNLRANVGRVWFAGEHTSINWFGFLHGAYYEGADIGYRVAIRLQGGNRKVGKDMTYYEGPVEGVAPPEEWFEGNGVAFALFGERT
ncbi:amine oxidase [Massarina eburnea CBS 473.64]|uniref:Amine oxidase n=1 Tax=Massarina eburnea CBS 473.64 TaxID=1395130 RepID=A0A6A6RUK1_9PLEO|nr:amine oxidase [Massarina eburnea CBS 473.64]